MTTKGTEVFLQLTTEIHADGDEAQHIEFATSGQYYLKEETHYYIYSESELSGMAGGKTTLKIKDGMVTMHRYGVNVVELVFIPGEIRESIYETPYGVFDVEMKTLTLETAIDERGAGHIEISYDIEVKGLSKTRNWLRIIVKANRRA